MRAREAGGLEPDDAEQRELTELWHISRTALSGKVDTKSARREWVIDQFLRGHPDVARKWVHEWVWSQLGYLTTGDPIPEPGWMRDERLALRRASGRRRR